MEKILMNYDAAKNNHVRADARKAVQIFLSGSVGTTLTIFPQALNPFLRAIESLGLCNSLVVIPNSDSNNKPVYMVVKLGDGFIVNSIEVSEEG